MARLNAELRRYGGTKEVIEIGAYTMPTLAEAHDAQHIDFFTLDVEGGELAVLKAFDFERVHVWIWCIEDNHYGDGPKIQALMTSKGYGVLPGVSTRGDLWFVNDAYASL